MIPNEPQFIISTWKLASSFRWGKFGLKNTIKIWALEVTKNIFLNGPLVPLPWPQLSIVWRWSPCQLQPHSPQLTTGSATGRESEREIIEIFLTKLETVSRWKHLTNVIELQSQWVTSVLYIYYISSKQCNAVASFMGSFIQQKDSPRYIRPELATGLLGKLRENLAKLVSWQEWQTRDRQRNNRGAVLVSATQSQHENTITGPSIVSGDGNTEPRLLVSQ